MPFAITRPNGSHGRLYIGRLPCGELCWRASKAKAAAFTDAEAETIKAEQFDRYDIADIEIEGVSHGD